MIAESNLTIKFNDKIKSDSLKHAVVNNRYTVKSCSLY